MKTSGFLISIMVFAGIVLLAAGMEINALQIAAVSHDDADAMNSSLVTFVENTTTKFNNINTNINTATSEISKGINLFSIFQLSPALLSIAGSFLDILFTVPHSMLTILTDAIPGIPPMVLVIAGACLTIFAAIKIYHELRGSTEV